MVHLRATQGNVRSREKTNPESCSPTTYDTAMRRKLCGARLTSKGLDVSETTPRAESRMDIASQPRTATMPLPSGRRSATLIAVADRLHLSRTKLLRLEKRRNHRRDVRKAGWIIAVESLGGVFHGKKGRGKNASIPAFLRGLSYPTLRADRPPSKIDPWPPYLKNVTSNEPRVPAAESPGLRAPESGSRTSFSGLKRGVRRTRS